MDVREHIRKHPVASTVTATVLIALGIAYSVSSITQVRRDADQSQAFFSIDDGSTWFVDASTKQSGFLQDGKPAYAVNVYVKDSGEPFVGFLRRSGQVKPPSAPAKADSTSRPRLSEKSKLSESVDMAKFAEHAMPPSVSRAPGGMVDPNTVQALIKRPGAKEWHPISSPEGKAILAEFGPQAQSQGLRLLTP